MSKKFDDFNGTINKILEERKEICKENVKLNEVNMKLNQESENLKYRLDTTLNKIISI